MNAPMAVVQIDSELQKKGRIKAGGSLLVARVDFSRLTIHTVDGSVNGAQRLLDSCGFVYSMRLDNHSWKHLE